MRLSTATAVTLAATAPFNAFPVQASAQEVQPAGDSHEVTVLNTQTQQDVIELGGKVLRLKKAAAHNRHISDVEVHTVAPGVQEVELDYTAKRPKAHASLGSYTIKALFSGKSKKLTAQNTLGVKVGESAGKRGPFALLEMKKTENGYSFLGKYQNKAERYNETLEATTYPAPGEKELDGDVAGNEMGRIMDAAAKGSAITKRRTPLTFKLIANVQKPVPYTPSVPSSPEPNQSSQPSTPTTPSPGQTPPGTTPPNPGAKKYPEAVGVKPWPRGARGYDVGYEKCNQNFAYPTDGDFAFIAINAGMGFTTNPCLEEQIAAFTAAGTQVEFYEATGLFLGSAQLDPSLCPPGDNICLAQQYGTKQADYAWQALGAALDKLGISREQMQVTHMLDEEPEGSASSNTWSTNIQENQAAITALYNRLRALGAANVIHYGTTASHDEHFGFSFKPGWHNLGATTWATAEEALTYCAGHEADGATSWGMQYDPVGIDKDIAC